MVMVNNSSDIIVIKVIVLALFFFTVALESRSNAKGISIVHPVNTPFPINLNDSENPAGRQIEKENQNSFSLNRFISDLSTLPYLMAQEGAEIICPPDISTYTDINSCTSYITDGLNLTYSRNNAAAVTWKMEGATEDRSPPAGFNMINDYTFNEGTTIITYTVTDLQQNISTCSFTITISDNQVPRFINLPENITTGTEPG
ncbi:MAG: HYR domain-containing protein, partial [Bacteroidales bacterium]|nr:HYR domain-containing protein [Bacteroidales bacterium]